MLFVKMYTSIETYSGCVNDSINKPFAIILTLDQLGPRWCFDASCPVFIGEELFRKSSIVTSLADDPRGNPVLLGKMLDIGSPHHYAFLFRCNQTRSGSIDVNIKERTKGR